MKMKVLASNMKCAEILLILLSFCLLIGAMPSMQKDDIVNDGNRVVKDESDNSSGSSESNAIPVTRRGKINVNGFMGRESDTLSCGYEVRYSQ